jgi:tRNA threonylcarbamoyladenosine biosynthesis protein TsaB
MSENWLLIETSGRVGKVGLTCAREVVRAVELDATRRHARDLATAVKTMLDGEGIRPGNLTGVMVSGGPGSYTGLRVGVMSAKALAYATGCQLVAVPTFAAIILRTPSEARHVWVIADALQGHIYLQRFTRELDAGGWTQASELRIEFAEDHLKEAGPEVWMSGPGVAVHAGRNIPQTCRLVAEVNREPTVESLFQAGSRLAPLSRDEMFRLEPLYLRGSSAEENAKKSEPRG